MEKTTRKLFLAVPAVSMENDFEPWIKKLKVGADRKDMFMRWTPAENRHVTVVFLGETSDEDQSKIREIAAGVLKDIPPLKLKIEDFGAFPDTRAARVIWCGVQNSKKLRFMRDQLSEALRSQGFKIETEYEPHLTIGRLRNPKSVHDFLSPFVRTKIGKLEVNEIVLFESLIGGNFPIYKAIEKFPLTGVETSEETNF